MGFIYLINTGRRLEPLIENDWAQPPGKKRSFFRQIYPGILSVAGTEDLYPGIADCTRVSVPNRCHGTDKAEPIPG